MLQRSGGEPDPRSEGERVVLLVVEGRGVTGAGGGRLCSVEAEGYVAGVHVVAQPLHAAGEARCVGVERSRSITRGGGGHPAVVNVDAAAREGEAASLARSLQQRQNLLYPNCKKPPSTSASVCCLYLQEDSL